MAYASFEAGDPITERVHLSHIVIELVRETKKKPVSMDNPNDKM